jgi:hypothetical protein
VDQINVYVKIFQSHVFLIKPWIYIKVRLEDFAIATANAWMAWYVIAIEYVLVKVLLLSYTDSISWLCHTNIFMEEAVPLPDNVWMVYIVIHLVYATVLHNVLRPTYATIILQLLLLAK